MQTEIGKDHVEDHELNALLKATVDMSGARGIGEIIPWLSFLDSWFILHKAKFMQIKRQVYNFLYRTIQEHRLYREANPDTQGKPRDFVDVLLNITHSDMFMDGAAVTDDMIACQIAASLCAVRRPAWISFAILHSHWVPRLGTMHSHHQLTPPRMNS